MGKFTVGNFAKLGTYCLESDMRDEKMRRDKIKRDKEVAMKRKKDESYLEKCKLADSILERKPDPKLINLDELEKILAPLRKQTDKAMPTKRDDLMKRYENWMSIEKRQRRQL